MQNEILWKIYFGKISFHKIALQIWVFNKNKLSHKPFREGFWPQIQNSQIEEGRTPNFGEYLEVTLTHSLTLTLSNALPLREKCPNTGLFLVRVFLYSDWIRKVTPYGPEITPFLDPFYTVSLNVRAHLEIKNSHS